MRTLVMLVIAAGLAGCGDSASEPESFKAPTTPEGSGSCTSTLEDYCRLNASNCVAYEEAITRRRALCSRTVYVLTRHCPGVYRSVMWRDFVLGGGDEYFNGAGQMFAASLVSDYGSAYCGRSFSQTFGAVPECPGEVIRTSLCAP